MSLQKTYRIQDTKLMDEVRNKPCVITGNPPPNDPSHCKSKGSFGDDVSWNICPLRHDLHVELHKLGATTFANKYPKYKDWLVNNGWQFDEFLKKWVHND